MSNFDLLYVEVLFISIFVLLIIFLSNIKNWKPHIFNPLSLTILFSILTFLLDAVWKFIDGKTNLIPLNMAIQPFYYTCLILAQAFWFDYVMHQLPFKIYKTKIHRHLYFIPAAIISMISFISIKTGWIYKIDFIEGTFSTGPLYYIYVAIGFAYLLLGMILCFIGAKKTDVLFQKKEMIVLSVFPILPLAGGIFQMFFGEDFPITCVGISLALLIVNCVLADRKITKDALTNLPNRYSIDSVLHEKVAKYSKNDTDRHLYIIFADCDDFKLINDTYGHLEGDRALCMIADILQKVIDEYNGFVGRYGGDEFTILISSEREETVHQAIQKVEKLLEEESKKELFKMVLSFGFVKFTTELSPKELMGIADRRLYDNKYSHKHPKPNM